MFLLFYLGTVKKEEAVLAGLFGKDYLKYKKMVPAFIPRLYPRILKQRSKYSLRQAHYNGELIRILVAGLLICGMYFFEHGLKHKDLNTASAWLLGLLACLYSVLLVMTIAHRKKFIKQHDGKII